MGSPIDRTNKTALDGNLVNGVTSDAPKLKANNDTLYNYVDGLNTGQGDHASAATLAHPDGSVTNAKLANGSVTTSKIADGAVTAAKVADGSLTAAKFVDGALSNETQNALNIVALQAETVTGLLNVVTGYGAKGDGVAHPLSATFPSLTAAQARYPDAGITSLTQQLNWAAFQQAFKDANTLKAKVVIPRGSFYIKDSLAVGSSTNSSIEFGNFEIQGAGKGTVLLFDLPNNSTYGIDVAVNATKLTIGSMFMKSVTPNVGGGIRVPVASMNVVLENIVTYDFYRGFDLAIYVGQVRNCTAGYGVVGFHIRGGTACEYVGCYGTSNTASGDVNPWGGCNWFIEGGSYCGLKNCAADGGTYAYKFVTTAEISWGMIGCGMEANTNNIYIDASLASIRIESQSFAVLSSTVMCHVENAQNVVIDQFKGSGEFNITKNATKIGVGVIRVVNSSPLPSNAAFYKAVPTIDRSVWGINDFIYDLITYGANDAIQEGRLLYRGNKYQMQALVPDNGDSITVIIDVVPRIQYDQTSALRAGRITLNLYNSSGVANLINNSTNTNIVISQTRLSNGFDFTIDPFNGQTSATASVAFFYVTVLHTGIQKNHNIITSSTFTGRTNVLLKGVDY